MRLDFETFYGVGGKIKPIQYGFFLFLEFPEYCNFLGHITEQLLIMPSVDTVTALIDIVHSTFK